MPENHLLRSIDRYANFDFVRQRLKTYYSETGRPSIDPERLLRIMLIGYLYGVTSERKLIEELRMHLGWRWFTGLTFDQEVPHHSTFSKNRHRRFQESKLFEQLFQQIVDRCVVCGLVEEEHLSVDRSFIHADANNSSRIPREKLSEVAQVNRNVRQYLHDLERENQLGPELPQGRRSVDYGSRRRILQQRRQGSEARIFRQLSTNNANCVIVGVEATVGSSSQEVISARKMLADCVERFGRAPKTLAADAGYGKADFLKWLENRRITP